MQSVWHMVSSSVLLVDFDASIYDTLFLSISVSSFINNFAGCRFIPDIWILIFAVTSVLLSKLLIAQKFNSKILLHFCRCQQHAWIYCVSIVSLLECIVSEVVMSFEWSLFFSFLLSENANLVNPFSTFSILCYILGRFHCVCFVFKYFVQ